MISFSSIADPLTEIPVRIITKSVSLKSIYYLLFQEGKARERSLSYYNTQKYTKYNKTLSKITPTAHI